jgi:5-methylcytosine-specific restriction endonuclease McrA
MKLNGMQNTLLLNAGYEPLRIIGWQRAFVLLFQGKVELLEEYGVSVHTVDKAFPVPAVVRLNRWVNLKRQASVIRFSRANVYLRDDHRCQYCYQKYTERELTLDHVTPVVRGGRKTWENIVTACIRCNQRKGDRKPEEVGLKLLRLPQVPKLLPGMAVTVRSTGNPELWEPYLRLTWPTLRST